MEGQIVFATSTLGFLVNQLSLGMPIRFNGIPENWRAWYIWYWTQENKQGGDKGYGQGGQSQGNGQRGTQNIPDNIQKRSGRDPKLYTGELFLDASPKLKGAFKPYFDAGYRKLYLTEILKDIKKVIDSLPKTKNTHTLEVQHYASNFCVETAPM